MAQIGYNMRSAARLITEIMKLKRILREPFLHFFVLGVLFFALFSWASDDQMRAPDEIVIDETRIAAIESQFERVWQRRPTPDEMTSLVDDWIREEVLYREGMALGLDRDDPVLRRRVAQKMEFISDGLLDSPPSEKELRAWYKDNADAYRLDPRYSFRQVYFNPAVRRGSLEAAMQDALPMLQNGDVVAGDATLLPGGLDDVALAEVSRTFGQRFAEALAKLPLHTWTGPIESGYGLHLVYVDERQDARLPAFDEVSAAVKRDYLAKRTRELKDAFYETIRQRYVVTYVDGVTLADKRYGADRVQ
jgi:hypothetical protein